LIEDGDTILIGISGGKDSLILTEILSSIRKYAQVDYSLVGCHVKVTDIPYQIDIDFLKRFCADQDVEFHYIERTYEDTNFDKNPCYFCSWTRKKVFYEFSKERGCKKLATGHHLDDAVETLLMNMIYHGSISSLPYSFSMFDGRLHYIRPLLAIPEQKMKYYATLRDYPKLKTECPFDHASSRTKVRNLVEGMCADFPQARANLFNAMQNINSDYLPE